MDVLVLPTAGEGLLGEVFILPPFTEGLAPEEAPLAGLAPEAPPPEGLDGMARCDAP